MSARPRLITSIPFWVLFLGSLVSVAVGAWLVLDKIGTMTSKITDGSATGVEVYAGQAWVTVGAALLTGGLIGLVLTLSLAVVRSFLATATGGVVEIVASDELDDTRGDALDDDLDVTAAREGVAPAREGVAPAREGVDAALEGVVPTHEGDVPAREGVAPARDDLSDDATAASSAGATLPTGEASTASDSITAATR